MSNKQEILNKWPGKAQTYSDAQKMSSIRISIREVSERLREVSERSPKGFREVSERFPRGLREVSERSPRGSERFPRACFVHNFRKTPYGLVSSES